ncbi:MAG: excinuclease ABC subunit UvrA [Fibrobacter sp.]|nr:excinuclease ABC subunit UvrA [Fibrobacter sp.]
MSEALIINKANENNLRNIDITIPRDALVVITGVSGSGKSSLAFDTIFQEGQRRYVESLSAYARQFIGSMKRPAVESIRGISPTISIDQKTVNRNPRSTVGTVIEITDHLRLLYARLGKPHCPKCSQPISAQTVEQITDALMADYPGQSCIILAPIVHERKGEYRKEINDLQEMGFVRVRINGEIYRLEDVPQLARYERHSIEIVIDRINLEARNLSRLREGVEQALRHSTDQVAFLLDDKHYFLQSTKLACAPCRISIPELEPRLFSFNDPHGQCPKCKGLGKTYQVHADLLINPELSINEGAIIAQVPAGNIAFTRYGWSELKALAKFYEFSLDTPWQDLPPAVQKTILYGSADKIRHTTTRRRWRRIRRVSVEQKITGIVPLLQELWDNRNISLLQKYMRIEKCTACAGTRLSEVSLAVLFRERNIAEISAWTVEQAVNFFAGLKLSTREEQVGREIFKEIRNRLGFLSQVGLGYLSLNRGAATLSGGEAQRIRLASQVGAGLQGVLYVLDEPSIGLHPRDNHQLLDILQRLRQQGNTVVIVEHDEDTMKEADFVVDIGPGAGTQGGEVVATGHWEDLQKNPQSLTGAYLNGTKSIALPTQRRALTGQWLTVNGARANNLKNIAVEFPLGVFVGISGVSGSGKSTLVNHILRKALAQHFHGAQDAPGDHDSISGLEHLDKVIEIDQSPIGRTPRSNPATYTKIFDDIRDLFATLPESKVRGYSKSRFSFNVDGGRCEECKGSGVREIAMQILPNVQVTCEVCDGKRFNSATLEIHYKGKTIADVLAMRISEAREFFTNLPKIAQPLQVLLDIGLGYLQLGQPSTTLSGGEAQRMKISSELRRPGTGKTLYLLDEPTTGLHFEDVQKLLQSLQKLVEQGNSLVVIEHNLDVLKSADWLIDMGPEAGQGGGEVVAEGTPEEVAQNPDSHTAKFLAEVLVPQKAPAKVNGKARQLYDLRTNIVVQGAKKHNLRNIDLEIPRHKFTVITGISGSGKSSLAFHTLFAEGQRRFVESLSTYARRFLGKIDRGAVDSIDGLAPAIAIDQGSASPSPRSTVATLTELYDYFRILWARMGEPHCIHCGETALKTAPGTLALRNYTPNAVLQVLAPVWHSGLNRNLMLENWEQRVALIDRLRELGFQRLWCDGETLLLDEFDIKAKYKEIFVIIDRIITKGDYKARLVEALESAFNYGNGIAAILEKGQDYPQMHSLTPGCTSCGWFMERELDPKNFSFNSHWGACKTCQGLGKIGRETCSDCHGERLQKQYLKVHIQGQNISQVSGYSINQAHSWFEQWEATLKGATQKIAAPLLREINGRLDFLLGVGLHYLGLDRSGDTLSGGEAQRIRLASQIGSGLEGVLYVLDEPTVGLHQRDTQQLIDTLYRLRDLGNTVVVVEHDLEMIRSADWVMDMGPGAGEDGGEVVAQDTPQNLARKNSVQKYPQSQTAAYMSGEIRIENPQVEHQEPTDWIKMTKLVRHNLQNAAVDFPAGQISVVSGVSGSGKSSLVMESLLPLAKQALKRKTRGRVNSQWGTLELPESIGEVVLVDQELLGGTPRSTPASYTKILDHLRKLYASLPQSKLKGFKIGRFSYNRAEGRCAACEGKGFNFIEMHFLSDVWEVCEQCQGQRYNEETLTVTFKGKTIADVLNMRVSEAVEFFAAHNAILRRLKLLEGVGLGYLRLGQSATALSGGEAQRLKLAAELGRSARTKVLYLLDEPTTGLHSHDIQALWNVLRGLVAQGHTVILVEHQMDMVVLADWVVDLGPEGGDEGGKVLFAGTVADFRKSKVQSSTLAALEG